jgi:hypothetical protein
MRAPWRVWVTSGWRIVGAGDELEAVGHLLDAVAVAHPDVEQAVALGGGVILDVAQQPRVTARTDLGVAVFVVVGVDHLAAEVLGHRLHAVADAEHRHAELEHLGWHARGLVLGDRRRAAGEDHAARREIAQRGEVHVVRVEFAVDASLAHAARDQLGVLRAEVEDQDAVGVDVGRRRGDRLSRHGNSALPW